jgi:hypothetical protein
MKKCKLTSLFHVVVHLQISESSVLDMPKRKLLPSLLVASCQHILRLLRL